MHSAAVLVAQSPKWFSKCTITSKNACHRDKRVERMYTRISDSQIAQELDVITQMAWISLQKFGHLGLYYY